MNKSMGLVTSLLVSIYTVKSCTTLVASVTHPSVGLRGGWTLRSLSKVPLPRQDTRRQAPPFRLHIRRPQLSTLGLFPEVYIFIGKDSDCP